MNMLNGLFSWLFTLDHKRIGFIYTLIGIWAGFIGLGLSLIIRLNLWYPYYNLVPYEVYNYVITSHGIVMIFFFLMPVLIGGFGNYLLPLLLSIPDLNLPRLNALSAWLLVPATICVMISMVLGSGVGWTFYPPLSNLIGAPTAGTDFLMFSLHLAGISSIFSSLNFICTIYCSISETVNLESISVVIWAYLFTSILLLFSLPVLAAGITMLLFDRNFNTSFFDPAGGGDPLLFQHLFWFFGHPEVYVLILPGFGMVSHICLQVSNNNQPFGYYGLVFAMFSIVCLGFVVWAHHMFSVGMDILSIVFFSSVTMVIGVPTGIKVFSWIWMLFNSFVSKNEPFFLWLIGFIILFTIGGVTGIVLSSSVIDVLFHDTWFVVAHFHYVFSLGSFSSVVLAFIWWFPIITGYSLNKALLTAHFYISMLGFNLCFFPMHYLGMVGLPRRVCMYDANFQWINILCSIGSLISSFSAFFLMYIIYNAIQEKVVVVGVWGKPSFQLSQLYIPLGYHIII
uniref:Cytochrome c oxidase subunit 1 n=1 Tax=Aglaiogyrodactylus forficulatus TaxID=1853073 RepID=A0A173G4S2_9PLAT|nr:cytochrome c oxidase subunit I [Aglaiogyrodactylus forficulatus]ANH20407.1 cytochrome c oxidase subunit I [Aglaiogyrodactylus forficulatus]